MKALKIFTVLFVLAAKTWAQEFCLQSTYDSAKTERAREKISFSSDFFKVQATVFPQKASPFVEKNTFSVEIDAKRLKIAAGDILFKGFLQRFRYPAMTSQSALQSSDVSSSEFDFYFPTISTGAQEKQSFVLLAEFAKIQAFSAFNFQDEISARQFFAGANILFFDTKAKTRSNLLRTRLNLSFAAGQHYVSQKNEDGWFFETPRFVAKPQRYFACEGDFSSPFFSAFVSGAASESPCARVAGFVRAENSLKIDFFTLKTKFAFISPDFWTEKSKLAEKSVEFFANPQVKLNFSKKIPAELDLGTFFQYERLFSHANDENQGKTADFGASAKLFGKIFSVQTDFSALDYDAHSRFRQDKTTELRSVFQGAIKPKWRKNSQSASARLKVSRFPVSRKTEIQSSLKGSLRPCSALKFDVSPFANFVVDKSQEFGLSAKICGYLREKKSSAEISWFFAYSAKHDLGKDEKSEKFSWGASFKAIAQ